MREETFENILLFLQTEFRVNKITMMKNEALKMQDYESAKTYREEEKKLLIQYMGIGEKLLNSEQNQGDNDGKK